MKDEKVNSFLCFYYESVLESQDYLSSLYVGSFI
jgi:hypothetical protein